jgi:hypothetical protein
VFVAGVLGGCMRKPVQLAASTIPLPEHPGSYHLVGEADARACQFDLFFLIPLGGNQLWKAKKKAVGDNSDGLIDVSVDSYKAYTPVGRLSCTHVKGLAVRYGEAPGGYGPVVIREREVLIPVAGVATDMPRSTTEQSQVPVQQAGAGATFLDAAVAYRLGHGMGLGLRAGAPVFRPGYAVNGDVLYLGIGVDYLMTGERSTTIPIGLRYAALGVVPDFDFHTTLEMGAARTVDGDRLYGGAAVGGRYHFSELGSGLIELGYPTMRLGVQLTW